MKITLQKQKRPAWEAPGHRTMDITSSLPFFMNGWQNRKHPIRVHRVRYAHVHLRDGVYSHTSFSYWCGNLGFIGIKKKSGRLLAQIPEGIMECPYCAAKQGAMEGRNSRGVTP